MAELNKEFLVNLQGKDFVTYNGLIDLAHQMELKSITTEIIQLPTTDNNNQCIVKAVATTFNETVFEGYGDADPTNVNRMIAKHLIRMAETRAKARALRDLTNVGMTAFEELGGEDEEPKREYKPNVKQVKKPTLSEAQIKRLFAISKANNKTNEEVKQMMISMFKKDSTSLLTKKEYDLLIKNIEGEK